jgi:hypothetical protein
MVEAPRYQLFSGARLTLDHDRRVRRRDTGDFFAQLVHCRAFAEEWWRFGARAELANQPPLGYRSLYGKEQLGAIRRLGEIAGRTRLEALAGGELIAVAGENDDRNFEPSLSEVFHQPEAIHSRHFDVEQGRVRWVCVESFQSLESVAGLVKFETCPGQNAFERFPDPRVVIDNKDCAFHEDHVTSEGLGPEA